VLEEALKVGVQLHPQHGDFEALRRAWQRLEDLGADALFVSDHLAPLYGDPRGPHYECWTTLAAMAATTQRVPLGALVSPNSFRNPDLVADMAHTLDHISRGRAILGVGAGWYEPEYLEYGYEFGTAASRVCEFEAGLRRMLQRLEKLRPGPVRGHLPILVGGSGERVLLRLVAEHADMWNLAPASPEELRHKNDVLDGWCREVGRDPGEIERSALLNDPAQDADRDAYVEAGATHLVVWTTGPEFDPRRLERLLEWRDALGR
jgi:probable F420-dependent oxidoreductase